MPPPWNTHASLSVSPLTRRLVGASRTPATSMSQCGSLTWQSVNLGDNHRIQGPNPPRTGAKVKAPAKRVRSSPREAQWKRTKPGKGRKGGGKGKSKGGAKPGTGFKDGTAVCAAWNSGKCSNEEPCPNGKHVCNTLLKNGRICGFSNHNRQACTNKSKK